MFAENQRQEIGQNPLEAKVKQLTEKNVSLNEKVEILKGMVKNSSNIIEDLKEIIFLYEREISERLEKENGNEM